jgi:uncharacterized cupin superfamily protein
VAFRLVRASLVQWRRSNQMKVLNTDLGRELQAESIGARYWRLSPREASTLHRHSRQEELYVLLEGTGRMRVEDDLLTLEPLDAVLVEPRSPRQIFNDTDADQLWLVVGAPREAVSSTLEMTEEQLRDLYPEGPRALPPELRQIRE